MKTKRLWGRIGVSIALTEDEEAVLYNKNTSITEAKAIFRKLAEEGRITLDGETYFLGSTDTEDYDPDKYIEFNF